MFGINAFRPWVGPQYPGASPKLLVLGESRYKKSFTDHQIIKARITNGLDGGQLRTFRKFERAVLGKEDSETLVNNFWQRTLFYNYNCCIFPGGPRVSIPYRCREQPENGTMLRRMLEKFKPSHVIVWGATNWKSIDAHSPWLDSHVPGTHEPYCATTIDGCTILFTRVWHPSTAFSPPYWHLLISQFLALKE
jgi:hypothetical protein